MSDLFWLSDREFARMQPYFPLSHGIPRMDNLQVISGIIFIIRNGLRWRDAPAEYGSIRRSTIGSCPSRQCKHCLPGSGWSRLGVFDRIFSGLAGK